ncbi:hypothetical protein EDI_251340 [Entamoeba dispar SAW760]|uniref:Uncharacterized protein n=1 Tax=Entamoeba dispar (strain ATCC PRA-260 / SAW760) TaxID=370354 RepID=B0E6V7_ENTDS|nr:uncharacterized protein EDI_251340 [Entamoeba dispar SAW760]EDR29698.1 hypothetical protein EDI_251340 [Entamoeba dispar SAW760]|eukprot:EDR29698.1 hypothetical protein EDI_251340 [Entamoeba dispar SAW760]
MGITSTQVQLTINKLKQINQSQKEFLEVSSQIIEEIEHIISEMVQSYEKKVKFLEDENKEIKQQLDNERNNHKKLLESQPISLEKNNQENDMSKQIINNQNDFKIPIIKKKQIKPQPRRQTKIKIMTTNEKAKRERAKMKILSDSQKQKSIPIKQEKIKNDIKIIPTTEFKELIQSNNIDIEKEIPIIDNVLKPCSEKLSILDSMNNLKLMINQMKLEMKDEFEEGNNDENFDSF